MSSVGLFASGRAAAGDDDSPAESEDQGATESHYRFFASVEAGYGARGLYSVPYWGPGVGTEVGVERDGTAGTRLPRASAFRLGLAARWVGGATNYGLPAYDLAIGPRVQLGFGRFGFGFGAGARLVYVQVRRRTTGTELSTFTVGLDAIVSFDVLTLGEGHAFFVALEPSLDPILTYEPAPSGLGFLWGAAATVGFRW